MALEKQNYYVDWHPQTEVDQQQIDTRFMPCLSYDARKLLLLIKDRLSTWGCGDTSRQIYDFVDALERTV